MRLMQVTEKSTTGSNRLFLLPLLCAALLAAPGCPFTRGGDNGGSDGGGNTGDGGGSGDGGGGTVEGSSVPGSCTDGIDNDNDSFLDCLDLDCSAEPACVAPTTLSIYDIRDPSRPFHPAAGAAVAVDGVVVTATMSRTKNGSTFYDAWVEEKAGGAFSGVILFGLPSALTVGDEVNFRGTMDEYFGLTEITSVTATVGASGQALPAAESLPAASLATASPDAEQWESVLVKIEAVSVTETPTVGSDGNDHGDFTVTDGLVIGHAFHHDYVGLRKMGDAFTSIAGVLSFSYDEFRLEPRNNDDITLADGSHPGPVLTTIYEIQDPSAAGHPADGAAVSLSGVVVSGLSAPDATSGRVNLVVQEVAGGPFSGIYVYNRANVDLSAVAVGDLVDLAGGYSEFAFTGDTDTVSEISMSSFTKTGTGTVPTPEVVAAADLAAPVTAEPWEGVLVEVGAVTVTTGTNQYGEFVVNGGLKVDDLFMGATLPAQSVGSTFTRVAGFMHYAFGYALVPRNAADLTAGQVVAPTTLPITSIQDMSAADHPAAGTLVHLVDAIVTGVVPGTTGVKGFTMQQGTGAYSGIYVYVPTSFDPGTLAMGDKVTVDGSYTEYNGLSEITLTAALTNSGAGTLPIPEALTDPTLFAGPGAEMWAGVLVTVDKGATKMVVDAAPDTYNEWTVDASMAVDDSIFLYTPTASDQIQSITGVVDYAFSHYRLWPRQASDIVP